MSLFQRKTYIVYKNPNMYSAVQHHCNFEKLLRESMLKMPCLMSDNGNETHNLLKSSSNLKTNCAVADYFYFSLNFFTVEGMSV